MESFLIDTHAHLDMIKKKTPQQVVDDAFKNKVAAIINVGSSIAGSQRSIGFSRSFRNVFATVGIHPHDVASFGGKEKGLLARLLLERDTGSRGTGSCEASQAKIVAIGETGFDFYRNLAPKKDQRQAFVYQIELAIQHGLPLIIHDRDAHDDTIEVLQEYASDDGFQAVMHCFSSDAAFALRCLDLGLFLSFTGVVTFPNAKIVKEAAREVPVEKMFLETDAPFLAPQPKRGSENYPEYVRYIADEIAALHCLDPEEVARKTSQNAVGFFQLEICQ